MSKIVVIYDNLDKSATEMQAVNDFLSNVVTNLGNVVTEIEALDSSGPHNAFSSVIDNYESSIQAVKNWQTQIEFLSTSCAGISSTFSNAEDENNADTKNIIDGFIGTLLTTAGITLGNEDLEIDIYNNDEEFYKENTNFGETNAEESKKTWNLFFEEKDGVVGLTAAGATITKGAKSIIDEPPKEETCLLLGSRSASVR